MTELIALFATTQIQWIVTLIAVDVILGVIVAIVKKEFRLGKLAKFMGTPVLGYVFGFAVLMMTAEAIPSLAIFVQVAYFFVILALVSSILGHLERMGLPVPSYLKKE